MFYKVDQDQKTLTVITVYVDDCTIATSSKKCIEDVTVWLACMPENCGDRCVDPMMGSGGLPEGRSESVSPRMEAGEPLKGRSTGNNEVSMSHGCSGQDLDYLACQPVLAWST